MEYLTSSLFFIIFIIFIRFINTAKYEYRREEEIDNKSIIIVKNSTGIIAIYHWFFN